MFKSLWEDKKKRIVLLSVVGVLLVAGGIFSVLQRNAGEETTPVDARILAVTPVSDTGHGVAADSAFLLSCTEGVSENWVKENLNITPARAFSLQAKNPGEFSLTFAETLSQDSIVKFSAAAGKTWAFQTESKLRVTGVLPADKEQRVPVTTGVEITLSYLDVPEFQKYFKIEPFVSGRFERHGKTYVFVPDGLSPDTFYQITVSKDLPSAGGETLGEDYVFSFRTDIIRPADNSFLYINGDAAETFAPGIAPLVDVRASEHFENKEFTLRVFAYPDAASYEDALRARHDYLFDSLGYRENYFAPTENLSSAMEFKAPLQRQTPGAIWSSAYLVFPDTLPEGYYLCDIMAPETEAKATPHLQKFIQVHSLETFALSVNGEEIVWV
jgi:hypothetical protein